uniref:Uncharacterized protein n=1 Tax=Candidatus Kentrum sp. UNK TaxID=2126344 RepID=A0A451ARX5_9GAMM|nr:MAG: hypothetical protein BECKUNK1418G_GA0071005_12704 [Candidatus Kentron sp. UNK]VFK73725.1 MAG: hypothetical protein BECKUNK1418H_GA0071006_12634 [Candidatus Kentron sp. UNK]
MNIDPIVEEIRQARREHAARFNYDLNAICNDFRKRETELRNRVVSLPPKRLRKETKSKGLEAQFQVQAV